VSAFTWLIVKYVKDKLGNFRGSVYEQKPNNIVKDHSLIIISSDFAMINNENLGKGSETMHKDIC